MEIAKLIEVENLTVCFSAQSDAIAAVSGINFAINRGETLGVVGESGSGKSVTALSIMQLLPNNKVQLSGRIWYYPPQGERIDLLSNSEEEMRKFRGNKIGMVFQEPMTSLNPVMRCGRQVMESLMYHKKLKKREAVERTLSLFERVQLPDPKRIFRAFPHELSGGQKQRVLIAIAVACQPELLIADEPTTALDVTVQKEILALFAELQKDLDMSLLFISHDLGVVAKVSKEVMVMKNGEILERQEVGRIFSAPENAYTKGLLACRPPLDFQPLRLPTVEDFYQNPSMEWTGVFRIPAAAEVEAKRGILYEKNPLLEVENLSCWFPRDKTLLGKPVSYIKAVNEVSLKVYPGEIVGLVGESGCGKTTLGRAIIQLLPLRSGAVRFDGRSLADLKGQDKKEMYQQMQMVFQDPFASLNPKMLIGDAIAEPIKVHRQLKSRTAIRERVLELLEKVGLEATHYHRYPHEFSGGRRQRICIARALALNPRFIICDESVSALDVSVQAQVLNLLLDLRDEYNFSCIFITHDLSVVRFVSDRVLVMAEGMILEEGWPEDIFKAPKTAYTRKLIEAIPR